MDKEPTIFVIANDPAARKEMTARVKSMSRQAHPCRSTGEFTRVYVPPQPGCVLLDVSAASLRDLELLRWLDERRPHLPVIVLSAEPDVAMAVRAMKLGALDFLQRPCPPGCLEESVENALRWDDEHRREISRATRIRRRYAQLTAGQREVLELILSGKSNREIAEELGLCTRSIEERRAKVMQTMRAKSLPDLVRLTVVISDE